MNPVRMRFHRLSSSESGVGLRPSEGATGGMSALLPEVADGNTMESGPESDCGAIGALDSSAACACAANRHRPDRTASNFFIISRKTLILRILAEHSAQSRLNC